MGMNEWLEYPNDRLHRRHPAGFVIIVPAQQDDPLPLACVICNRLLRSRDDEIAHREFGCCDRCAMTWAHPRRLEWAEGWRPNPDDVARDVALRPPIAAIIELD
jgi:hypothetical protein